MNGFLSTFRARLVAILVFINICVLALGAFAYLFLGQVNKKLEEFTGGIYHRLEISNSMRTAAEQRAIAVRNLALITDASQQAATLESYESNQKAVTTTLAELQHAVSVEGIPDEVKSKVKAIAEIEAQYAPTAASIVAQLKAGEKDTALQRIREECNPTLARLNAALSAYADLTDQRTRQFIEAAESSSDTQRRALLGFAVAFALLVGAMGYVLRKQVYDTLGTDPETLRAMIARMADGDLATSTGSASAKPNSVLAALGRMRKSMGSIVGQVRQASDSIATGSTEIASGNADLSVRTEEQASNLQAASASMVQIRSMVDRNADTARQASQLANAASDAAKNGGSVMQEVVDTMQDIAASSQKMSDIIGVIDGIAFQTNILALNAAVEAARAGEQGRGFAVVAGEVRSLAQRSAEAAREIKTLISSSNEKVDNGKQLVQNAGSSIGDIVGQVGKVASFIEEISSSALEQKAAIGHVSDSVGNLDQVTQQNAALVEESAAAAESLKHQAAMLADLVNKFQVSAQEYAVTPIPRRAPAPTSSITSNSVSTPKPSPRRPSAVTATPPSKPSVLATTADDNDWTSF